MEPAHPLAGELERARAEGAASLDKLDTCNAAHKLSQLESHACTEQRSRDNVAHDKELESLRGELAHERSSLGAELTTAGTKLHACEENAATIVAERDELSATMADQQTKWSEEQRKVEDDRDHSEQARTSCEANVAELTRSQSSCRDELAACTHGHDSHAPTPRPQSSDGPYPD